MQKSDRTPADLRDMFGTNLRMLSRQYASISELSRQLGINRTQLNRYLSGESFPRPDVLDRICRFFGVDARILLEPVEALTDTPKILNSPFLSDHLGKAALGIPEDIFPSGFYRFARRSFIETARFVVGLVYVFRDGKATYVRGFEAKAAMRQQGLPCDARTREFRGYVSRQDDGISLTISRRDAMTSSFNFLSRVPSFENNFWVGYVTRTIPENVNAPRVTRMVYEHLGNDRAAIMRIARTAGLMPLEDLPPFHARLLQPGQTFR